jgi:hypothetical protein
MRDVTTVVEQGQPDVFAHNIETVDRLQRTVRDARCSLERSLAVLAHAKKVRPDGYTKSSIMVGLGETDDEVLEAMQRSGTVGVDVLTLGQYLRPTPKHHEVDALRDPDQFGAGPRPAPRWASATSPRGPSCDRATRPRGVRARGPVAPRRRTQDTRQRPPPGTGPCPRLEGVEHAEEFVLEDVVTVLGPDGAADPATDPASRPRGWWRSTSTWCAPRARRAPRAPAAPGAHRVSHRVDRRRGDHPRQRRGLDDDWLFPCYREFGALLLRGMPLQSYIDNMYGNGERPGEGSADARPLHGPRRTTSAP